MSDIPVEDRLLSRALPPWWLFLIAGIGWTIVGVVILRFDYTSVRAVSILFGCVFLAAGIFEILNIIAAGGWWKLLYIALSLIFIVAGIVAFIHPGNTFRALAAVLSFFLIFAGTFYIIFAIAARHEIEVWWLQLVAGIVLLLLGFWAAGYYGRSAVLLIAFVAAFTLVHGVTDIVAAFRIRSAQHAKLPLTPTHSPSG